jgi:hypothetical protein
MIDGYEWGKITVSGELYEKDLIVFCEDVVLPAWWRKSGHVFAVCDLDTAVQKFKPEVLVAGLGHDGVAKMSPELVVWLDGQGVDIIARKMTEAVDEFNKAFAAGRKVLGAFRLTC